MTAAFDTVFEASPTAQLLVRADPPRWTIVAANAEYRRLTHKRAAELAGRGTFEAFPESHGTESEGGQRNIRGSFEKTVADRVTVVLPIQRYDIPGLAGGDYEEHYWRLSSTAIEVPNQELLVLHQVENVTRQMRSESERNFAVQAATLAEDRLRTVFAEAPVGIAVLRGPEHVFESANASYVALIGGRPLTGLTIRQAFPDLASQPVYDLLDQVYRTGVAYTANEMLLPFDRRGDGTIEDAYFNFVYQPLRDPAGAVEGIAVVVTGVTDLVVARLTEARARGEAESANRAKADFLAAMSHELRTPLNAVAGYIDLLEVGIGGTVTAQQHMYLMRIRRAQSVLARLVEDILTFARIDAGRLEYHIEQVSFEALLASVEALVAPQLAAKGLSFEQAHAPDDVYICADRDKSEQILLNLLSNAIKFTETGVIAVACEVHDDDVAIEVCDTGRGIPSDKLDAIFDPFVQIDSGLTRTLGGSGLGLSISRDLARAMRGDLTVESRVGQGSTFTLTLPRR